MDVAPGRVNIPAFRQHHNNLSGAGVIVGVVDTGIDAAHPAFAGRILRLWDQNQAGAGVAEGNYGRELTGATMTNSRDTHGHGTHVAGIAASADATFGGVAPAANLVVVKTTFQDANIADGVRYIFRVARDLGRPAVVNLSLGGQSDAHDGSDSLSAIIDAESGRGRIVCCAAGNEGNDNIHAQTTVTTTTPRRLRFRVPPTIIGLAELNGWYQTGSGIEVAVRSPGGFVTPFQPVITGANFSRLYVLPEARVRINTPGPDPANNAINFSVQMRGLTAGSPVRGGVWQLLIRKTAAGGAGVPVDIWTLDDQDSPQVVFSGTSVRDSMKIGSPGAAAQAVTVASFTTKIKWIDIEGQQQEVGLDLNDISDFSSEGPLRNQAQKPDVAAPGAMIVSARSRHAAAMQADLVANDFQVMAGTSMATPFIAGLVALLLERDPTLDPAGVKQLLHSNAAIPNRPAGTFNTKWGFGLIDALNL
jgi:subtilisin family serine protease